MTRIILLFLILTCIDASAQDISITTNPVSLSHCVGKSANIFINAESKKDTKLNFQWYKDGQKIFGAIFPFLNFPYLQHYHSGTYFCRIINEEQTDSVDSQTASVYVVRPTSIIKQPEDVYSSLNDEVITLGFEAHINGIVIDESINMGENVNIQWFTIKDNFNTKLLDDDIYKGINSNKLSINTTKLPDTSFYYAEIEGLCGKATTKTVKVIKNLNLLKVIIKGIDACEGNNVSIYTQIFNPKNQLLEFNWYKDGKPLYFKESIKGIYSDELKFKPIYMNDAGKYKLEARIFDMNFSVFSNEIEVNVDKKPKITCFRIDTLIGKDGLFHFTEKKVSNSWLNIFYESNSLPIQFDIYKDGILIASKYSDSSMFSLGNINYLDFIYNTKDSSRFWVVAQNKCGYDYSDTISLYKQTICDPFNQFHTLCTYEPLALYINYKAIAPISQLDYRWYLTLVKPSQFLVPTINEYVKALDYKLELKNTGLMLSSGMDENESTLINFDTRYVVNRWVKNDIVSVDEFCCYYIKIGLSPVIIRQPKNKQIGYGKSDTLVYIYFDNEYGKKLDVELYYMASLIHKPRLVDKSEPDFGKWYRYIRESTFADDGYYYAVAKYNNLCNPVFSDTIKVTVIPKGGITNVNEKGLESDISIYPNPASDYITINLKSSGASSNENNIWASPIANEIKIYNFLSEMVMFEPIHPMTSSHRMNIQNLPVGLYIIRIGNYSEKFVVVR